MRIPELLVARAGPIVLVRSALVIASLLVLCAAEVLHREQIEPLEGAWLAVASGHELRFTPPPFDHNRHVRLRLPGLEASARVSLNDHPIRSLSGSSGEFDASDFLRAARPNLLLVENSAMPSGAEWIITPRVFITRQQMEVESGKIRASVWVRNTLENTAIISVAVSLVPGGERPIVVDATVGPNVTQEVVATGKVTGSPERVRTLLSKEEEAMEGAYQYEIWTTIATKSRE